MAKFHDVMNAWEENTIPGYLDIYVKKNNRFFMTRKTMMGAKLIQRRAFSQRQKVVEKAAICTHVLSLLLYPVTPGLFRC